MDKNKQYICGSILAGLNHGISLPTREHVQAIKHGKLSLEGALNALGWGTSKSELVKDARTFSRQLKQMSDDDVRKTWPDVHAIYAAIPPEASFTGNGKPQKPEPVSVTLLPQLNDELRANGKPTLKRWRGTRAQLVSAIKDEREERMKNIREKLVKLSPAQYKQRSRKLVAEYEKLAEALGIKAPSARRPTAVVPTVVAEGAYDNNREAVMKTGHTKSGPSKSHAKKEARKAKHVERATREEKAPRKLDGDKVARQRVLDKGETSLSAIAASLNMTPKNARAKARKHAKEIAALQVKGKKYIFTTTNTKKVVAILEQ